MAGILTPTMEPAADFKGCGSTDGGSGSRSISSGGCGNEDGYRSLFAPVYRPTDRRRRIDALNRILWSHFTRPLFNFPGQQRWSDTPGNDDMRRKLFPID